MSFLFFWLFFWIFWYILDNVAPSLLNKKSSSLMNFCRLRIFFPVHQSACNTIAFPFSRSGWLLNSCVEIPQTRSQTYIVLESFYGNSWPCNSHGMDLALHRFVLLLITWNDFFFPWTCVAAVASSFLSSISILIWRSALRKRTGKQCTTTTCKLGQCFRLLVL